MFGKSNARSSVRDFWEKFRTVTKLNNREDTGLLHEGYAEQTRNKKASSLPKQDVEYFDGMPNKNFLSASGTYPGFGNINVKVPNQTKNESLCVNCQRNLPKESDHFDENTKNQNNALYLDEASEVYVNRSVPRGFVFMHNFEIFEDGFCPARTGSKIDYKNLLSLFTEMGYKCDEKNEFCKTGKISAKEFDTNLRKFSKLNEHRNIDSCIVVVMSHGCGDKKFLSSDGKEISVKNICQMLNNVQCKYLKDKPKILIFQFCRTHDLNIRKDGQIEKINLGTQQDNNNLNGNIRGSLSFTSFLGSLSSVSQATSPSRRQSMISASSSVFTDPDLESNGAVFENLGYNAQPEDRLRSFGSSYALDSRAIHPIDKLQINSDFYLVFSTVDGEVSYRDPKSGSILIKAICSIFKKRIHKDDVEELFRKVSISIKQLAISSETEAISAQTCERTNIGLDKKFYFNPIATKIP